MANKIYSSSSSGYLILSNLKDSTYNISLGFPASQSDELKFALNVSHADKGYLLKKFDDGHALFDLQDLTVIKPIAKQETAANQKTIKREDDFTKLLSKAVDDETLLTEVVPEEKKQVVKEEKKVETTPKDVAVQTAVTKEEKKPEITTATDVVQTSNTEQPKEEAKQTTSNSTTEKPVEEPKQTAPAESKPVETKPADKPEEKIVQEDKKAAEQKEEKVIEATIVNTQPIGETKPPVNEQVKKEEPKQEQQDQKQDDSQAEVQSPYIKSTVTRRSESSTTEGFGLVYLDNQGEMTDTIRLLIPNPKVQLVNAPSDTPKPLTEPVKETKEQEPPAVESKKEEPVTDNKKQEDKKSEVAEQQKDETAKEKKPLFSIKKNERNQDAQVNNTRKERDNDNKTATSKSSCKATASENDFLKLRKNMAAENDEESMIDAARKYFKSKCFATEQVKHLSALFLTEESKYNFFDASYKYVHDKDQFSSLQSELKEEYFIKRFKALIGE